MITLESPHKKLILQSTVNFDSVSATNLVWFVGKGDPSSNSPLHYGRLQWDGSDYSFLENPWSKSLSLPAYYDIDDQTTFKVPQEPLDGSHHEEIILWKHGSRFMNAVVRDDYLWTCHQIGVNKNDGTYTTGTPDFSLRAGVRWIKISIPPGGSISDSGTVFDTASSDPHWYFYPSIGVNSSGEMVLGFAGSRGSEYLGAFFFGKDGGTTSTNPVLIQAGRAYSHSHDWGHYTHTTVDSDGTFWTLQEHSEVQANANSSNSGTRIVKIRTN